MVKWIQARGQETVASSSKKEGDISEQDSEEDEFAEASGSEEQESVGEYESGESQESSDDDLDVPPVVNKFSALVTGD